MRKTLVGALVLVAAVASGCDSDRTASAHPTPGGVVDQPAAVSAVPVDLALSAASAYFAAFNGGDVDAFMALLPAGATFSDSIAGSVSRDSWEQRLAWNLAQGTRLAPPDCIVPTAGDPQEETVVRCESATLNAPILAVGAHPVPTTVVLSIAPNGIQEVHEEYGQPDFLNATEPFMGWLEEAHPAAVDRIGFGAWGSIAEAWESGQLTAEYARLWAADLEASCREIPGLISPDRDSYLDDC